MAHPRCYHCEELLFLDRLDTCDKCGKRQSDNPRSGAVCWRCGEEPYVHLRFKPRRPVCARCILDLITTSLALDELEDGAPTPEEKST